MNISLVCVLLETFFTLVSGLSRPKIFGEVTAKNDSPPQRIVSISDTAEDPSYNKTARAFEKKQGIYSSKQQSVQNSENQNPRRIRYVITDSSETVKSRSFGDIRRVEQHHRRPNRVGRPNIVELSHRNTKPANAVVILLPKANKSVRQNARAHRRQYVDRSRTFSSAKFNAAPQFYSPERPDVTANDKLPRLHSWQTSSPLLQNSQQQLQPHFPPRNPSVSQSQQKFLPYFEETPYNYFAQSQQPRDPLGYLFQGFNIFGQPFGPQQSASPFLSQQPVITLKQTVAQPRSFVQSSRPTNIPPSPPPPPPPPPHIPPPQFSLPLPPPQPRRQTNMDYRSSQEFFAINNNRFDELNMHSKKVIALSPNEKLGLCCRKRNLPSSCQTLCNYDTFTDRSLVNAVLTNQCPGPQLTQAFDCATSMADHTECCIRNGIGTFNGGQCMAFCTTHRGNPNNAFQYIGCLQVFDRIKQCYSDYHINHPNIFGDF